MYVGVTLLVVYGSDMGLHTGLSVGIVGWIVGWVPLWVVFKIQKLHRGCVLRGCGHIGGFMGPGWVVKQAYP